MRSRRSVQQLAVRVKGECGNLVGRLFSLSWASLLFTFLFSGLTLNTFGFSRLFDSSYGTPIDSIASGVPLHPDLAGWVSISGRRELLVPCAR